MEAQEQEYEITGLGNFIRNISIEDPFCWISYNPSEEINLSRRSETAVGVRKKEDRFGNFYIFYGDQREHFKDCNTIEDCRLKLLEMYDSKDFDVGFWSADFDNLREINFKKELEA